MDEPQATEEPGVIRRSANPGCPFGDDAWRRANPENPSGGVVVIALSRWDSPVFAEALLVWTGYGRDIKPRRHDASVVSRFGATAASELLPAIKSTIDEFYLCDAKRTAPDLAEMGRMAMAEFKTKHPEVADEVLDALAWCYTFDFR